MTEQPVDRLDDTANMLGFDLPEACRDGVAANLELLARHARTLLAEDEA